MDHPPANSVHEGVGRFEIFDFAPERLPALRETVTGDRRPFSIHSPLSRRRGRLEPAHAVFFLSSDPARRESSFVLVEETLAEAKEWGAEYVVAHMNWVDDSEDASEARRLALDAARRLSQLSERYGVELHVECGGYSGAFHHPDQFGALAREFPALGLCLDKSRAKEILSYHMKDPAKIKEIAVTLNAKYPSHAYPILFGESRRVGLHVKMLDKEVNNLLLELNELYSEMGQRATTDFDEIRSHSNEILNILETSGKQIFYQNDKEWFYRTEERRWVTLNDNSNWHRLEKKNGKTVRSTLHIS